MCGLKRLALSLMSAMLVVACGGGGGGGGGSNSIQSNLTYTGNSNTATVNATNASSLTTKSISGQNDVSSGSAGTGLRSTNTKNAVDIAKEMVLAKLSTSGTRSQIPPPDCGGSVIESPVAQSGDTYSGTITYNQYCTINGSETITMSGTVAFSVVMSGQTLTSLTITFIDVTATSQPQNTSVNLAGSVTYTVTSTGDLISYTMVVQAAGGGEILLSNYTIDDRAYPYVTISGQLCHWQYGCVTISTPTQLDMMGTWPTSGQLLVRGANGSRALLTATGSGYTLQIDSDGNGTYEQTLTNQTWPIN